MDRGTETQIELEKNKVDDAAAEAVLDAGAGVNGTFVSADMIPQTIVVQNGIIISIT
jgi:hypothetical protein